MTRFSRVKQGAESDVEEVTAATGGVENGDGGQALLKGFQPVAGGQVVAIGQEVVDLLLGKFPLAAERLHDHRLHHELDVGSAGVVGAKLGALGGVEGPLEQGAEDGGLDVAPVLVGGVVEAQQSGAGELDGLRRVEQVAVEVADLVRSEETAVGHLPEQALHGLVEG